MYFNITAQTSKDDNEYSFKDKQKIELSNAALFKSVDSKAVGFISGTYYIQDRHVRHGRVKINAHPSLCDNVSNVFGWISAKDIKEAE